jgi:hypothetical protein
MRHHTKDKGDQGLGHVIGDLLQQGIQIALPLSEHLPFDLVAVSEDGLLRRVQVKYRAMSGGVVECRLASSWADRNGTHSRAFDARTYDALAIFCPDPRLCCYLRSEELPADTVKLRVLPAKNGQAQGVRLAADFTDPHRIFISSAGSSVDRAVAL